MKGVCKYCKFRGVLKNGAFCDKDCERWWDNQADIRAKKKKFKGKVSGGRSMGGGGNTRAQRQYNGGSE